MSRRATRRATRETTNLLTTTPDDVALGIAWALCRTTTPNAIGTQPTEGRSNVSTTAAADLCRLARACRRFSSKHCWVVGGRAAVSTVAEADASMWSIVEEAARRWLAEDCGEQERGWVPARHAARRRSPRLAASAGPAEWNWLTSMARVELLQRPLVLIAGVGKRDDVESSDVSVERSSDDGRSVLVTNHGQTGARDPVTGKLRTTKFISSVAMTAGVHYCEFTIVKEKRRASVVLGVVVRTGGDLTRGRSKRTLRVTGVHFVGTDGVHRHVAPGRRTATRRDWEGMQPAKEGDCIGLLLDLNAGSLAVYKNGRRLGLMVPSGLNVDERGEPMRVSACTWIGYMFRHNDSVRVEAMAPPAAAALVEAAVTDAGAC
jgi:hypothetical protein